MAIIEVQLRKRSRDVVDVQGGSSVACGGGFDGVGCGSPVPHGDCHAVVGWPTAGYVVLYCPAHCPAPHPHPSGTVERGLAAEAEARRMMTDGRPRSSSQ